MKVRGREKKMNKRLGLRLNELEKNQKNCDEEEKREENDVMCAFKWRTFRIKWQASEQQSNRQQQKGSIEVGNDNNEIAKQL